VTRTISSVVFLAVLSAVLGPLAAAAPSRPNILIILADDLGYSDLGCYGGEIATPNLDRLAEGGLRFTQFYNTARCWPTRAAVLTGYYPQQVRRDTVPGVQSGSRGMRPSWARLLPDLLEPVGYRSYHSGKWHVDGMPLEGGFDRSYLLQDCGRFFSPRVHFLDDQPLPPVQPGTAYYSTQAIADQAIQFLREHAEKYADRPFFQYLAFTSPHFPLHALQEDVDLYRDTYRDGWEEVRSRRWERIQEIGLVHGGLSEPERDVGPPYDHPAALETLGTGEVNRPIPWNQLTSEQRELQAVKMALHAAMVDRMDREIGRVLEQVRTMGAWENTLVLFLSDNGASAEIMVRDDGHDPAAAPGSAATHFCLGPGWSTVANTPFRMHKTWVHEGGISTPLIVHWPAGFPDRGELRHQPGHVIDLVPTLVEAAGASPPVEWEGRRVPALAGRSLIPALAADASVDQRDLWWAHEGHRAVRAGNWKLVAAKGRAWQLFDLSIDRAETNDVSGWQPEKVRELEHLWTTRWHEFQALAREKPPAD
jgi:arylsulfatase